MSELLAGAARRVINPPLGTRQTGFRLFGNPVQAIESDLTATALVLGDGETRVVVVGIDLSLVGIDLSLRGQRPAQELRLGIAEALGLPVANVLLNTSHVHSGVALPDYMPDTPEQMRLKEGYRALLGSMLVEVAQEADSRLQPARIGCGWGTSRIGVYRRESRDGRDVLGEVPAHPIDDTVGVVRVDDRDGRPIATLFRYSCHPVTMGPRSAVVSSDFPGVARQVVERSLGGLEDWARLLVEATERKDATSDLFVQAIRVNDIVIVGMNAELFFETGLEIRARSPFPDTLALGYTNGTIGYLPRAEDHPEGGWDIDVAYAVPDLIFQVHPHPVALHPSSERRAVGAILNLIGRMGDGEE